MAPAVVLVTSRSFSSGDLDLAGELTEAGCEIVTGPPDHDLKVLRALLAPATAWVAGAGPVTADHLDAAPNLQIVARYGVGVEAVDLAAAAERGILVTNTPGANSGAVADHAVALILAALRDVAAGDRGVRAGRWAVRRTRQLGQLTVGIVGLGRIGREVASRLSGFGSALLGYDPWVPQPELDRWGIERVDLEELARRSDVITLHAPGDTVLVDASFLGLARPNLVLVNTARAGLVDEAAVADALRSDRLRTYATDVLGTEAGGQDNPLLAADLADHTLFTPHAAAQTVEAVDQMGRGSVDAVLAQLRGEQPPNLVPLPQRNPPAQSRRSRMTTTTRPDVDPLAALRAVTVVAVLRAPTAEAGIRATAALVAGGVTGIEITYSTPDAAAVIREVRAQHGDRVYLGAGTVLQPAQAGEAVEAGAEFLVSPGTEPRLAAAMLETGAVVLSGALTPSEVMATLACGVHVVKLFPASLGGLAHLKALRAPFPDVAFVPTGGVDADNLGDWLAAGAIAIGTGGDLCPPAVMAAGDWDTLTATARRYTAAAQRAREQG